ARPRGGGDDLAAFGQLQLDLLSRLELLRDVAPPGGEDIRPGFDRVDVARVSSEPEATGPAVIVAVHHRGPVPLRLVDRAMEERGADDVVAVAEDIGPDFEQIADDALDRIAAAVDLRVDGFDDDAIARRPCGMLLNAGRGLLSSGTLSAFT